MYFRVIFILLMIFFSVYEPSFAFDEEENREPPTKKQRTSQEISNNEGVVEQPPKRQKISQVVALIDGAAPNDRASIGTINVIRTEEWGQIFEKPGLEPILKLIFSFYKIGCYDEDTQKNIRKYGINDYERLSGEGSHATLDYHSIHNFILINKYVWNTFPI